MLPCGNTKEVLVKFIRRKNGRQMADIRVTFTVGGPEIAEILCGYGDSFAGSEDDWLPRVFDDEPGPGATLTRTQVDGLIRWALRGWGTECYDAVGGFNDGENYDPDQALLIVSWAVAQVRRLYPALDDPALAGYLRGFQEDADEWHRGRRARTEGDDDE